MKLIQRILFTGLILVYFGCKESDEQQPIPQTTEKTKTYYKALFSIDGDSAQNQYFQHKKIENGFEISEHGVFFSNSAIIAKARLRFVNDEYEEIEINFDNGNIKSDVVVERKRKGVYYSYLNSNLVDSIKNTNAVVLFDGPNPSFDYVNSTHLLLNVNSAESDVVLINWVTGGLSTEKMQFKKTPEGFEITKIDTQRKNTITLNNLPLAIELSRQNNEEHKFTMLDDDPGYFD